MPQAEVRVRLRHSTQSLHGLRGTDGMDRPPDERPGPLVDHLPLRKRGVPEGDPLQPRAGRVRRGRKSAARAAPGLCRVRPVRRDADRGTVRPEPEVLGHRCLVRAVTVTFRPRRGGSVRLERALSGREPGPNRFTGDGAPEEVPRAGLEPAASRSSVLHSPKLSYRGAGRPDRTGGIKNRRAAPPPTETARGDVPAFSARSNARAHVRSGRLPSVAP